MKYGLLCLVCVAAIIPYASANMYDRSHPLGLDYWHPYGRLSTSYETPHVKWAKPLADGTIKALVLAPQWTFREAVELAQRLDVKITPWMCWNTENLTTSGIDPASAAYLVSRPLVCKLLENHLKEPFDVYIVGKLNWDILPAKNRFELLKKVSKGAGLVLVCPPEHKELNIVLSKHPTDDAKKILQGLPWQALPRLKGVDESKLVQTSLFGKGRVVKLDYQQPVDSPLKGRINNGMHSLTPNWVQVRVSNVWGKSDDPQQELVPYEYYHSLVAKAVCWAAGRSGKGKIEIDIPRDIEAQKQINVHLDITPTNTIVRTAIRDTLGTVVAEPIFTEGNITMPGLVSGDYMLDIWLRDKKDAVLDWGSWAFSVYSASVIKDVKLSSRMFDVGDMVKGDIYIDGSADSLHVELWDNWNRKIDEKQITINGNQAAFDLGPLQPVTTMHRINAELLCEGNIVAKKQLEFPVRVKQKLDDFSSVIWCEQDNSYPTWAMLRKLHGQDEADVVDTLPGSAWMVRKDDSMIPTEIAMNVLARNVARSGLLICPYNNRFGCLSASQKTHVVLSRSNMISQEMLSRVQKEFTIDSSIYAPYGPYVWTHGDESFYSHDPDLDWGPGALRRFRQEAEHLYGSLEKLNKEWNTAYTDLKEVMPLTFEQAKESKNYAPWVVHRLSSNAVFAEFYEKVGNFLRVDDPGAKTGFDGGCSLNKPNMGSDLWRLSKHVQLFQSYNAENLQMEIFRCFAPADAVRGMWYGTYGPTWSIGPSTIEYCHYHPWYSLFHSLNSSWFWTNGSPGPMSGHAQDMTSLPFMEARTRALRQIKGGIGKLLLASKRQNDKIAIHFSESSRIVECFYQETTNSWCDGWVNAIMSVARMLEDAGFQYEFVSYEQIENGKLEKDGFKAFFMPHSRAISKREARQIMSFVEKGGVAFADIVPGSHNAAGTQLKEGLLIDLFPGTGNKVIKSSQGKAVLYGQGFNDYGSIHKSMTKDWKKLEGRWHEMAKLLVENANIRPVVRVTGGDIPPVEVARFDAGGVEFIGLIRSYFLHDNDEYSGTIDFGRKGYIYNVRKGKLLGHMRTMPVKLDYQARLFAVSPYRVDSISLKSSGNSIAMTIQTKSEAEPATHVFHLSVFGPDGKERSWYSQNILVSKGKAKAHIPFALNDKGEYSIKVRDVTSGITAQMRIER